MLSPKQLEILSFAKSNHDALICDGSVRSGKTSVMTLAFVWWACSNFNGQSFIIGGKTVESAVRNVINPFLSSGYVQKYAAARYNRGNHTLTVTINGNTNDFIIFGGKDESSFSLVQGFTAAGVFIDEVVLCCQSFVEQCLARCSVDGSKYWFNCNPSYPEHWFKREWIDRAEHHNARYIHFELSDNPSLSDKIRERYERMYSGVFYDRYIKGRWVIAEGLVYQEFDSDTMMHDIPEQDTANNEHIVSIDYGITNPFVAILWVIIGGKAYAVDEYCFDSAEAGYRRTDEEHYQALRKFIGQRFVDCIIIDPSATSFRETVARYGDYDCIGGDNSVIDGISNVMTAFKAGCLFIGEKCQRLTKEIGLYRWNEKAKKEEVVKDNDHACDAMRYFVNTVGVHELSCFLWD